MKVCIIGAGKRIHEMYGPVLSTLKENVEVCGFWNRNEEKGNLVLQKFGWKRYPDLDFMIKDCCPDAIIVVVNSSSIKQVVIDCMKYKIPIVMETPVWDFDIPNKSKDLGVSVYVNEQTPFLPCEEFKMMLLETGLFGSVTVAMNDCRTFEYHGISQLRRYVGFEKSPIEVVGSSIPHYPVTYEDNNGNLQHHTEGWEFGTIKFNSGQIAVYNFSSIYNRAPFRKPRSMRIYCNKGTISNDDNDFEVHLLLSNGKTEKLDIKVDGAYMSTNRISTIVQGKIIVWEKEENLRDLNDQQIAVRNVLTKNLKAINENNQKEGYTSISAAIDVNLLFAIRNSSQIKKFIH